MTHPAVAPSVWVAEQVEDHASGWVWGVFSTKEGAEKWCHETGHDSVEITEHAIDERLRSTEGTTPPNTENAK